MYRAALSWRRRCGGSGGVFCRSPELLAMVRVNEKEATAITRHLGEHEGQAPLPLPVAVPGDAGWYRIPPSYVGGSCAYLDETGSCRLTSETSRNTAAHDSGSTPTQSPDLRPTPCRTFPLWPDALASEFDWFQRYPALARGALETIDTEAATKGAEEAAAAATAAAATDATDAADATDTIDGADAPTDPVNTISPAELARVLTHHCAYMSGDIDEFEYDEARALIEQLPEEDLEAFVTELEQTQTREVVYQDDEVTVLEAPCEPPPSLGAEADARVQCLYFNERPELIQSSMYLTEAPAHFLDQVKRDQQPTNPKY